MHTTQRFSYGWCQRLTCDCLWLVAIKYNGKERDKDDDDDDKKKMRKKMVSKQRCCTELILQINVSSPDDAMNFDELVVCSAI